MKFQLNFLPRVMVIIFDTIAISFCSYTVTGSKTPSLVLFASFSNGQLQPPHNKIHARQCPWYLWTYMYPTNFHHFCSKSIILSFLRNCSENVPRSLTLRSSTSSYIRRKRALHLYSQQFLHQDKNHWTLFSLKIVFITVFRIIHRYRTIGRTFRPV